MASSIRILNETRIDIDGICERIGGNGKPAHPVTAFRLMTRGIKLADGSREYLESLKIAGRLFSSVEALERFVCKTNGIELDSVEAGSTSAPSKRRAKELADVDVQLAAAGI
jgi:hypothetical protein